MKNFRTAYVTVSKVVKVVKAVAKAQRPGMDEFDLQAEREAMAISAARKLKPARSLIEGRG